MSPEGRIALQVATAPGLWIRAGQVAVIVGLNWAAVPQFLPAGADRDRILALLKMFEIGMLEGVAEKAPKAEPGKADT